jgi:hypothetical protein
MAESVLQPWDGIRSDRRETAGHPKNGRGRLSAGRSSAKRQDSARKAWFGRCQIFHCSDYFLANDIDFGQQLLKLLYNLGNYY